MSPGKEVPIVVGTQNEVQQNAWRWEARRCSSNTVNTNGRHHHAACDARHCSDDAERLTQQFEDWLTVIEEGQGQLSTAHQTDLCLWFHEERLAAKTPFAAVVPCPASLQTDKARHNVIDAIDNFAFPTFYVQTLPMGAKLSEVSQVFVRTPAHLPEAIRYSSSEVRGKYAYSTVACHNGADAMDLISRYVPLQDAVRDVPCLLLNDFCPMVPLCLRCLVVAGHCVAAEVACDEAYTPLFGIRPNNADGAQNGFSDGDFMGEEHTTFGERRRTSAATRRREAPTTKDGRCGDEAEGDFRTASDVIAYGLKRFVEETLGASLGGRSYTALIAAEVKGFDPRVLGPRESDPPFWPVMTDEPLHLKASPFGEAGLRFYALSFDYADPTPFEAFAAQELHAVGDYVIEREAEGVSLPPILRFLDGHEAERAATRPPPQSFRVSSPPSFTKSSSPASSIASNRVSPARDKKDRRAASHRAASSAAPPGVVDGASTTASSPHRSEKRAAAPRHADVAKDKSSKIAPEKPTSPVKSVPIVLEPHDADNRGKGRYTVPGRKVDPADVDDVSSAISSSSRTSSRLPSRTSSFNRPTRGANGNTSGNGDVLGERPATVAHADPSAKSYTATTTASSVPRSQSWSTTHRSRDEVEETPQMQRDGSVSVDHSETASSASTHASRLPERRLSSASSSVAGDSQRSSVQRADDSVSVTESVRSSLPPRRRSSVLVAGSDIASSSPKSSHRETSKCSRVALSSTAAKELKPEMPSPMRPEDIPVVKSPSFLFSQHSSTTHSIVSDVAPSTRSSQARASRQDERPVATATATASSRHSRRSSSSNNGSSAVSATEKEASPAKPQSTVPRSVASSVTWPMTTSASRSQPSHLSGGNPQVETFAAAPQKETASEAESASTRTTLSAVPSPHTPSSLHNGDAGDDDHPAAEVQSEASAKPTSLKKSHSAYSSTYASTRSSVRRPDVSDARKEDIPWIPSPLKAPASSQKESSVVPSSLHNGDAGDDDHPAAEVQSEASAKPTSLKKSHSAYSSTYASTRSSVRRPDVSDARKEDIPWIPSPLKAPASSQKEPFVASLSSRHDNSTVRSAVSSVKVPYSGSGGNSAGSADARAVGASVIESATSSAKSSVRSPVKLDASVEAAKSSTAPSQLSEVPDALDLLSGNGQVQPAEDAVETPAATPPAAVHSFSSSSSSSSSCSYSHTSSMHVVSAGEQPPAPAQPTRRGELNREVHSGASSQHEGGAAAETLTMEIDTERSQTSRGGSEYFNEEKEEEEGGSHTMAPPAEALDEEEDVDVDVDASVHHSASQRSSQTSRADAAAAQGPAAAAMTEETEEESLAASAHSFFETTPQAEAQKANSISASADMPSKKEGEDTAEEEWELEEEFATPSDDAAATPAAEGNREEETGRFSASPVMADDVAELQSSDRSSNITSHWGTYPVSSADLHSCVSASVVSSRSTALRRWASGPASEVNYAASRTSHASRRRILQPVAEAPAPEKVQDEHEEEAAASTRRTPSIRSAASKRSDRWSERDRAQPLATTKAASRHSSATSAKSETALSSAAKAEASRVTAELPVGDATALAPSDAHSLLSSHPSSGGEAAASLLEHSSQANSDGRRDTSTPAEPAAELRAEGAASVPSPIASPPASAAAVAPNTATLNDRDAALRKARLRAIAAVIVANAAYEEVERVSAMYKEM